MSSSATSDSSLHSRPDKRPATPEHSPLPKRTRPAVESPWSDPATPDPVTLDRARAALPRVRAGRAVAEALCAAALALGIVAAGVLTPQPRAR